MFNIVFIICCLTDLVLALSSLSVVASRLCVYCWSTSILLNLYLVTRYIVAKTIFGTVIKKVIGTLLWVSLRLQVSCSQCWFLKGLVWKPLGLQPLMFCLQKKLNKGWLWTASKNLVVLGLVLTLANILAKEVLFGCLWANSFEGLGIYWLHPALLCFSQSHSGWF